MVILGNCAFCGERVERGQGHPDRIPVRYVKGFGEIRSDGGVNALLGGAEAVRGFESKLWHKKCAFAHRDLERQRRGYVPPGLDTEDRD